MNVEHIKIHFLSLHYTVFEMDYQIDWQILISFTYNDYIKSDETFLVFRLVRGIH